MTLSILIPTLASRSALFNRLLAIFRDQIGDRTDIQILHACDRGEVSVGRKRQSLLEAARGEYIVFFDDDDMPAPNYIAAIMKALESKPDCVGFKGWLKYNRKSYEWYISNSLPYVDAVINNKRAYLRHTNHLAPVRREIALQVGFQDLKREEDHRYAVGLRESGLLKTEVFINDHLYNYIK